MIVIFQSRFPLRTYIRALRPAILGGCIMRWLNFELDSAMEQTARVLSQFGNKDQPSKDFQTLIRQIGEAKTKHVSTL